MTHSLQKQLKNTFISNSSNIIKIQGREGDGQRMKLQENQPQLQHQLCQQHQIQEIAHGQEVSSQEQIVDCDADMPMKPSKYRRSKKERKTRTLITKQKLLEMNKIFHQYINNHKQNHNQNWNLKAIAQHLELGYSTILHKFRQFRAHKKVKAGALITSMQKKRKYKKSLLVQQLILEVMNQQQFFTASEMTNYIQTKYGMTFSRSIISRHLGQMGYSYKNVTHPPNTSKFDKIRRVYTEIMRPLIERNQTLIYIDQMTCYFHSHDGQPDQIISILMACTIYGVLYFHLQDHFITRERFYQILKEFLINLRASPLCKNIQGSKEELYLVVDMNSIHRDNSHNLPGIASMLIEQNVEIYYIPPCTPQFNPLEAIFAKIREKLTLTFSTHQVNDPKQMWQQLERILDEVKADSMEDYFIEMCQQMEKYMENPPQQ